MFVSRNNLKPLTPPLLHSGFWSKIIQETTSSSYDMNTENTLTKTT